MYEPSLGNLMSARSCLKVKRAKDISQCKGPEFQPRTRKQNEMKQNGKQNKTINRAMLLTGRRGFWAANTQNMEKTNSKYSFSVKDTSLCVSEFPPNH